MKNVSLKDFEKTVTHTGVEQAVFDKVCKDKQANREGFKLGFLPESEFIYYFKTSPDVFFAQLPIKEVYYESYRTFVRLSHAVDIEIISGGSHGKLYIRGKWTKKLENLKKKKPGNKK